MKRDQLLGEDTLQGIWTQLYKRASIVLYSVLFYSSLVLSILFNLLLSYPILFYSILFYSILFYPILFYSILFYSALGCDLLLQKVALHHNLPAFSIPCSCCPSVLSVQWHFALLTDLMPFICPSVLLVLSICCHSFWRWAKPISLRLLWHVQLCLSLCFIAWQWCFGFCLSVIWLAYSFWFLTVFFSSFLTNAFIRDHVWHLSVTVGKTF